MWEFIHLTNGSQLTLDSNLVLSASGAGDGVLSIDASSSLLAGGGVHPSILASAQGQPVLVQNAGLIDLTNGGTGPTDSLTVFGSYVGLNGRLALETTLGTDGSPSDRLVISTAAPGQGANASGATGITITNVGGLGALTTGSGILVVDAINGATTDPGSFFLTGPVVAGPFEYILFRGNGDPNDWYLRSTIPCPFTGRAARTVCFQPPIGLVPPVLLPPGLIPPVLLPPGLIPPGLIPPGTIPPGLLPPGVLPPGVIARPPGETPSGVPPQALAPNIRQEVSLYAALPALSLLYGRTLMDTLHERVGGDVNLRSGSAAVATVSASGAAQAYGDGGGRPALAATPYPDVAPVPYANGAWGRVIAQHGHQDGDPIGIFGDGPKYDYDFQAIQAGVDVLRWQGASGVRTHAGIYGALGDAQSNVTHFDGRRAGRDTFAAYTVGGYWTWIGQPGWYLDNVVQGTWYDVKGQSTRLPALETDGWGVGASLEGGYPLRFAGGWTVEPQAQLVYQSVDLGDARDIGAKVRFEDVDSLAGRVGVRFVTSWLAPGLPTPVTAWVRPSVWEEFLGNPRTLFSSQAGFIPFSADLGETWAEINTGIAAQVGRSTVLYASGSYEVGFDGRSDAWDGKIGLRVSW